MSQLAHLREGGARFVTPVPHVEVHGSESRRSSPAPPSGIGHAVARALAEDGYGVAARSRAAPTGSTRSPASSHGLALPTDVSDRGQVQELVERAVERFGRIDVGRHRRRRLRNAPLEEIDEAAWDEVMNVEPQGHVPRRPGRPAPPAREPGLPDHLLVGLRARWASAADGATTRPSGPCAASRSRCCRRCAATACARRPSARAGSRRRCSATAVTTQTSSRRRTSADAVRWLLSLRPIVQIKDLILERTTA